MGRERDSEHLASKEIARREAIKKALREAEKGPMGGPILTVSRDFLSGGGTIANKLAAKLGWNLYDRELIESIAADRKVDCRAIEEMDENVYRYIQEWANEIFLPGYVGQAGYMKALTRVLLSIVKDGNAIVIGRGAHLLIPTERRLAVRLIAPLPARIENYVRRFGSTPEEARERIVAEDRRRKEFLARNFKRDIDDPLGYDLVINTAEMDPNAIQQVIQAALRSRFDLTESALERLHPETE
ncbi:MAG: cytidylate kinase-like family protein [Candidatus Eisenbacteria bacterium]|nr:cytidylate kinase-like family protein [Candidatus Eisenbacteria bacterium]